MKTRSLAVVPLLLLCFTGCKREEPLTGEEAGQALEEMEIDSQSQALTSNTVEIATNFTIGEAVEKAADDLRAFIESQLPCAEVTLAAHTLTVVYGAKGLCPAYRGHVLSGTHTISVSKNDEAQVVVDHVWDTLSNGRVQIDGTATVTWDLSDPSRHVEHEITWKRLSDGRTGKGTGNRVQRPLSGGILEGFSEDGSRAWDGKRGHWSLDIDQLEMRWIDPVPQSGSLTLDTPFDKTVSASFERVDADTIHVTLEGAKKTYGFDVSKL